MTGYGFCFRPMLGRRDCSGRLHLWVSDYRGKTRFLPMNYDIRRDEWDPISGIIMPRAGNEKRRRRLAEYAVEMKRDLNHVALILKRLESRGHYTVNGVIAAFKRISNGAASSSKESPLSPLSGNGSPSP